MEAAGSGGVAAAVASLEQHQLVRSAAFKIAEKARYEVMWREVREERLARSVSHFRKWMERAPDMVDTGQWDPQFVWQLQDAGMGDKKVTELVLQMVTDVDSRQKLEMLPRVNRFGVRL